MEEALDYRMDEPMEEEEQYSEPKIDRDTRTNQLLDLFHEAEAYRQQFEEEELERYKLYIGYREPITDGDGNPVQCSNLHIPRTYEQIDTLRARIFKSFTSTRPYIDFLPRFKNIADIQYFQSAVDKSNLASAVVDNQLEINDFKTFLYDFITNFLVYRAAVVSVGWRYETAMVKQRKPKTMIVPQQQTLPDGTPATFSDGSPINMPVKQKVPGEFEVVEEEQVIWDDNELRVVDFFDFWPDPHGWNIDTCRYVFEREWMKWSDLEAYLDQLDQLNLGTVYEPNRDELGTAASELREGKWDRLNEVGISLSDTDTNAKNVNNDMELYEVLHYWEDGVHAVIVNRKQLVYDGDNPYWRHRKKPYAKACFEPLSKEFYGMSGVQVIEHLQHELNTTRNQRVDNVSLILNRMWKRKRSADINDSQLVSRPNGVIDVDNPDDITPLETMDITASAYNEEQIIKSDMENAIATPAIARGASASNSETATEIVTKNTNAGIRYEVKIMLYECMGINRIAYLMDMNNQQFIEEPRLVHLANAEGLDAWKQVDVETLLGEHDYRPAGSSVDPTANREIKRQQLLQLYDVMMKTQNPYNNLYALTRQIYETFDIKNVEELLIPKEVVDQQQAQQQAMMQAQLQAQQQQTQQEGERHQMDMMSQGIDTAKKLGDMFTPNQEPQGREGPGNETSAMAGGV